MNGFSKIAISLTVFLITSCNLNNTHKIKNDQRLASELRKKAAGEIKKQLGLYPMGTMGQMMYEIEKLGLAFQCYKPLTIEEGREYLIKSTEIFLDIINSDERIRPYLCNFPFTAKNIWISISIKNPDRSDMRTGQLVILTSSDGILTYDVNNPFKSKRLLTVYEESFTDALKRIEVKTPKYPYSKGRNIPLPKKAA